LTQTDQRDIKRFILTNVKRDHASELYLDDEEVEYARGHRVDWTEFHVEAGIISMPIDTASEVG